ncbi:MAG: CotH kinase family protein [Bacteroidetes bacterium]|nr:CotH kinase family protein [Bacteroidota bacterium]
MKKLPSLIILALLLQLSVNAQVVINEIMATNADLEYDPDFYNFSGWVELYNAGSNTVSLDNYYLSDSPSQLQKWKLPNGINIPAKGFFRFWADNQNIGVHTNFSLDSDGEDLILSVGSTVIDQITFPKQYLNVSYGRTENGGKVWGYLLTPTGSSANLPTTGSEQIAKPTFSLKAGRYTSTQQLTLSHGNSSAQIRFTADGSEPTAQSNLYNGPLTLSTTVVIKAKAFLVGNIPSETEAKTYFINEHNGQLPMVSISTKADYLWNDTFGIYTDGTNGAWGNCVGSPKNWNQDWARHAVFEYFDAAGNRKIDQHVDIRIGGACSRNFPQKSFAIKARNEYGSNQLKLRFFEKKSISEFGGIFLRNSGNDFNVTQFRDALIQEVAGTAMNIDYMAYQPTAFYLNGNYWGIQNLREKIDADFIESNYGYKKDEIDLLETYENALEGTNTSYISYKNALRGMNRKTEAAYNFIDQNIDIDEYINYLVTEIYFANTDWPGNNTKFWRPKKQGGKFRWILWDTDFGMGLVGYSTHPTLSFATDSTQVNWPNPASTTEHIRMVLQNPNFKAKFIQRLNASMLTNLRTDRLHATIDRFSNRIQAEMPFHKARWGGSVADWNGALQVMKSFASERPLYMFQHMAEFFGLQELTHLSISTALEGTGSFKLNGIQSDVNLTEGNYFKNLAYTIEPIPAPGYRFKHWITTTSQSTDVPLVNREAVWKYSDTGVVPAANWSAENYSDGTWSEGPAQLGYGDGDEKTIVSFGGDANNKFITTYFRKSFTIADTVGLQVLQGSALFDDGIVIYLNGQEVMRSNMPAGSIGNSTLAVQAATEGVYVPFTISKGLIKPGKNVLAVEIHQSAATSSDISFDLELSTRRVGNKTEQIVTKRVIEEIAITDASYVAVFEEDNRTITNLKINEINANGSDDVVYGKDWIEIYNAGTTSVDLNGLYLTDKLSQKINHRIKSDTGEPLLLAAGAFQIFFADEKVALGQNHLSFQLSADGEEIGLYHLAGGNASTLDEVTYGTQNFSGSFSRIPDGTGSFFSTISATPLAPNNLVLSANEPETLAAYPNPFDTEINISSDEKIDSIELFDIMGRKQDVIVVGQRLETRQISSGIYLLKINCAGKQHFLKLVKN